jgi:hypothetical protein
MNIAFIDDLQIFRVLLAERLICRGHRVVTFADYDSFFSVLTQDPGAYDLVITDHYLGNIDAIKSGFAPACRFYHYRGLLALSSMVTPALQGTDTLREWGYDLFIDKSHSQWPQFET